MDPSRETQPHGARFVFHPLFTRAGFQIENLFERPHQRPATGSRPVLSSQAKSVCASGDCRPAEEFGMDNSRRHDLLILAAFPADLARPLDARGPPQLVVWAQRS